MVIRKNTVSANMLAAALVVAAMAGLSGCSENVEVASTPEEKQAVLSRIRPVVTLDDLKTAPAAPAAPAAAEAAPASEPAAPAAAEAAPAPAMADAKPMYDKACMACHSTGAAGAPMLGDKAAWEARAANGVDALVASAKAGKGAMPPNGGSAYNEDEMRQVIEFMLAEAGLL